MIRRWPRHVQCGHLTSVAERGEKTVPEAGDHHPSEKDRTAKRFQDDVAMLAARLAQELSYIEIRVTVDDGATVGADSAAREWPDKDLLWIHPANLLAGKTRLNQRIGLIDILLI